MSNQGVIELDEAGEQSESCTGDQRSRVWITTALSVAAVLLLVNCLFAKHFAIWSSMHKGLGTQTVFEGVLAMITMGVAFGAPVYSAFIIALAPFSLLRRLPLGVAWFGAVMIAFTISFNTEIDLGAPAVYSMQVVYALPVLSLGWLLPFAYLHWFRGWRLNLPGFETQNVREPITISTLLSVTFLVALCFFSLQFSSQRFIVIALIGMLAMTLLGSLLACATWFLMRTRFVTITYLMMGTVCYILTSQIFLLSGAGPLSRGNALVITAFLLSSLIGVIIVRLGGGKLLTRRSEVSS